MAIKIAVANQKGGIGKTTTALALASGLIKRGYKVLLVDTDPQRNSSKVYRAKTLDIATLYDIFFAGFKAEECIQHTELGDVIASDELLKNADVEIKRSPKMYYYIKNALRGVEDNYDFIIIDCPPSSNMLTVNALTASDTVLVPIQCEYYALEGLSQLIHTIELVQDRLNPDLNIEGVVFTMYDARTNLSLQVVENVKGYLHQNIYKTIIPRNVRLAEAPSHGLPINLYDSKSAGAEAYRELAQEVLHKGEEEWQ